MDPPFYKCEVLDWRDKCEKKQNTKSIVPVVVRITIQQNV